MYLYHFQHGKNHISPIALLVAGGLLVSILIRFLLGLS